jgi:hypothetical protein
MIINTDKTITTTTTYLTMDISPYKFRLQEEAKSTHICKAHAAAVFYKGQPVSYGHNSILGKHSSHAEFAAIRSFLLARGLIGWVRTSRTLWGSHQRYEKGPRRPTTAA